MKHTYSAGGVVLNDKHEVLLINEGDNFWGFPRGRIEPGEDTLAAARREIKEEAGLTELTYIRELGSYQRHPVISGKDDTSEMKNITLLIFTTNQELPAQNDEDNEVIWVAANEVASTLTDPTDKQFYQDNIGKLATPAQPSKLSLIEPTDPLLNQIVDEADSAEINSSDVQNVIDRMLEMAAGKGKTAEDSRQMVGLAAPQIGVSKRIVLIDVTADGSNKEQHLQVFINPKITHRSQETMPGREGCWSCGNICGNVDRAKQVTLEGFDRTGKPIKVELTDFVARIAQHETDHLDGIRFPDRIPVDEPERLHWVEPAQFEDYRNNWQRWLIKCPRERWESLKSGKNLS